MRAVELFARVLHPAGSGRQPVPPVLDRVLPPEQCDDGRGDVWVSEYLRYRNGGGEP